MNARILAALGILVHGAIAQTAVFDDRDGAPGEWGFRPVGAVEVDPPAFVWRPQAGARIYRLQIARDARFTDVVRDVDAGDWPIHCPPEPFGTGAWHWRVAAIDHRGATSTWSRARRFEVRPDTPQFAIPGRDALLARVPDTHPRLFVRPSDRARLRELAGGRLAGEFGALLARCESLLTEPPDTTEPAKYPAGTVRGSEAWRAIWWGNRQRTIAVLESAATLAFAHWMADEPRFAEAARKLLMAATDWDPRGATGYRYNDEAGMPFAYHFARTYTFLHDRLSEDERARCRKVLRVRGREMFEHLCPNHFWRPYSSHSNRAWHFLGEVAIALHGEVQEADQWLWFAMNVFGAVYPVWSDADGGWHEGMAYWRSYLDRFTWWADVMRVATGVDAYRKPFFARAGDFALYLQPPGTRAGGFGDLSGGRDSRGSAGLVGLFAQQAGNPYWQWYREAHLDLRPAGGYVAFLRATQAGVAARSPAELPTSKLFAGTGIAALNTTLLGARDNVEVVFKSSPFGTQSHGYEAQNSFLVYAYGERLLIRSGRRDTYGSAHHRDWMWSTRSTNSITVGGLGQGKRTADAVGRVVAFETTPRLDLVEGEAADAYGGRLERFTRTIVFAKPGLIVVFDRLTARAASTFEWWLHAQDAFTIGPERTARTRHGAAACEIRWLVPSELVVTQTDRFDPPPVPRIQLVQHHLTARTTTQRRAVEFVTVIAVHPSEATWSSDAECEASPGGYRLRAQLRDGNQLRVALPRDGTVTAEIVDADSTTLVSVRGSR